MHLALSNNFHPPATACHSYALPSATPAGIVLHSWLWWCTRVVYLRCINSRIGSRASNTHLEHAACLCVWLFLGLSPSALTLFTGRAPMTQKLQAMQQGCAHAAQGGTGHVNTIWMSGRLYLSKKLASTCNAAGSLRRSAAAGPMRFRSACCPLPEKERNGFACHVMLWPS